jgi:hypothetical protein
LDVLRGNHSPLDSQTRDLTLRPFRWPLHLERAPVDLTHQICRGFLLLAIDIDCIASELSDTQVVAPASNHWPGVSLGETKPLSLFAFERRLTFKL